MAELGVRKTFLARESALCRVLWLCSKLVLPVHMVLATALFGRTVWGDLWVGERMMDRGFENSAVCFQDWHLSWVCARVLLVG